MKYSPQIISGVKLVSFALLVASQQLFGQSDDFSDGDFTRNPVWEGTDSSFVVENGSLRLMADPDRDMAFLSTYAFVTSGEWQIDVSLDFNPSGSNYARIYLLSDKPNLSEPLNGYFVQIGSASDDICFYRQEGYSEIRMIDGSDAFLDVSSNSLTIYITRSAEGLWQILEKTTGETIGSFQDSEDLQGSYFGLSCHFTATRADKFYFDNISVSEDSIPDTPGPVVQWKDVIITEIFPNPSHTVGLPPEEFIEILNRKTTDLNLDNWTLTDGASTLKFAPLTVAGGHYAIIALSPAHFLNYGDAAGGQGFPSLNNSEDKLVLRDAMGSPVDSVHYFDEWYRDDNKREGGWSLEIIDLENLCEEGNNWIASNDPEGGTPGRINSVNASNPDVTGPFMLSVVPAADTTVVITFNENLSLNLPPADHITITPENPVLKVSFSAASLKKIILTLSNRIEQRKKYTMTIRDVYDCSGNPMVPYPEGFSFGNPETAQPGDLLINEILFNPNPTGSDFVEIVNVSDKYINVRTLHLSNLSEQGPVNVQNINEDEMLLPPDTYLLITEDIDAVMGEYVGASEKNMLEVSRLPPLNDDEGSLAIGRPDTVIDDMVYNREMHNVFLRDDEGVSLERISFAMPSKDPANWISASSDTGFATPGYPNSNKGSPGSALLESVTVEPEVFVPIVGQPDYTLIHYRFDKGGYIGNVKIFDSQGRLTKQIANSEILGTEGTLRWEGDSDDGQKVRIGSYMIVFEVFDSDGSVKRFRERVAVGARF